MKNNKGFTLIEMLVVTIIVGILASIAIPQYQRMTAKSHFTKVEVMAKALRDSCNRLVAEFGVEGFDSLPDDAQVLQRLDIGESALLPKGFTLDTTNQLITGSGFNLQLTGDCSVNIDKVTGDYAGVHISYNGRRFICTPNNTEGCEAYGLD